MAADSAGMRVLLAAAGACLGLACHAGTALAVPIQPGAFVQVGSHPCTLGFVFDGTGAMDGREFISTARHCVDVIGQHALDGRGDTIGRIAFISSASANPGSDFALIEIGITRLRSVSPALRGHSAQPSGSTTAAETPDSDPIVISGYGDPFVKERRTREQRTGRMRFDDAGSFVAQGPIATGDSGAPIVEASSGKAIGTVADLCFGGGADCNAARGPTVQGMLALTAQAGMPLRLRRAGEPPPRRLIVKAESQRLRALHPIARVRASARTIQLRMRRRATVRLRVACRVAGRWVTVRRLVRRAPRGTTVIHLARASGARRLRQGRYLVVARPAYGRPESRHPVRTRFVVRR
jgi:trypsin